MITSHNSSNNYCLYLRKSRADQEAEQRGEGETLARHEHMLLELAKKHKLNITKVYKEIVSGESIDARPQVQALLSDINEGLYAGVLVMEVERLARGDTIDQGIIAKAFKYSNTLIITPIKVYDPTNEFDEEYFEFGLFMSRREYKVINRRIQHGRIASINDGKYISPVPPYGYDRYKLLDSNGYSLRPNEEEAKIVKLIFDLYVNGIVHPKGIHETFGSYKIARYLEEHGISHRGNSKWSASSVRDILKNPVYTGKICWGKRKEIKKIVDGKTIVTRPDSKDFTMVDGLHEAIISEELFAKAQEGMKNNTNLSVNKSKELQNPLAGLIYCKKCGRLMTRLGENKKNKYATLKCPERTCDNVSAPIFLVEKVLIDSISDWFEKYKIQTAESRYSHSESEEELIKDSIDAVQKELDELYHQQTKTYELLEKEIYTVEIFTQRNIALTKQISEASARLESLNDDFEKLHKRNMDEVHVIPLVTSVLDSYWTTETAAGRNDLLKAVLESATYCKEKRNTRTTLKNTNFELQIVPKFK